MSTPLVGTQALLGEGWDAPSVNTLVLASYVGSYMTVEPDARPGDPHRSLAPGQGRQHLAPRHGRSGERR